MGITVIQQRQPAAPTWQISTNEQESKMTEFLPRKKAQSLSHITSIKFVQIKYAIVLVWAWHHKDVAEGWLDGKQNQGKHSLNIFLFRQPTLKLSSAGRGVIPPSILDQYWDLARHFTCSFQQSYSDFFPSSIVLHATTLSGELRRRQNGLSGRGSARHSQQAAGLSFQYHR